MGEAEAMTFLPDERWLALFANFTALRLLPPDHALSHGAACRRIVAQVAVGLLAVREVGKLRVRKVFPCSCARSVAHAPSFALFGYMCKLPSEIITYPFRRKQKKQRPLYP